jgi:L-threonylcarbamoyladenylate synthase
MVKIVIDKQQINLIKNGAVVVMPTDTVYGLVCCAKSPEAVKKMYKIKHRSGKLGTIVAASVEQLRNMGFDQKELRLAYKHWPDTVSVVLAAPESLEYLHMGLNSLAVRIPEPMWLRELLEQTGPLATTSANYPDQPTAATIIEAKAIFGNKVDAYFDGGDISNNKSSSIIIINSDGSIKRLR